MTQTQFLLFFIAIIPLANCLLVKLSYHSSGLISLINKLFPFLYLANLIGLSNSLQDDHSYLALNELIRGVSFGFVVDQAALAFLFILNFLWIVFIFYSSRFLKLSENENIDSLQYYFILIISFLSLIILSKNLLTTLFFFNLLILTGYFFAIKFLHKKETKFSRFFTILLYLQSLFFFLAILATYKFTGQIEFVNAEVISQNFDRGRHSLLLILFLAGLFLSAFFPFYLFYQNISLEPIVIYALFFLSYGFSSLYIFAKILNFNFGFEGFSLIISKIGFSVFEWIFLINITIASLFLFLSKGIKSSFFYLFFQQFCFTLFLIFLFGIHNPAKIYIAIFSFLFSFTLIFLCISNFTLFLSRVGQGSIEGLFYKLTATSSIFLFSLLNLMGLAPGFGFVEKFFVVKILISNRMPVSTIIVAINLVTLIIFTWKIASFLFSKIEAKDDFGDYDIIAKDIDFDSQLILTTLAVCIVIFSGFILYPFISKFFINL